MTKKKMRKMESKKTNNRKKEIAKTLKSRTFYLTVAVFTICLFLINITENVMYYFNTTYSKYTLVGLSIILGFIFIYFTEHYDYRDHPFRHISTFIISSLSLASLFIVLSLSLSFLPFLKEIFVQIGLLYVYSSIAFTLPYTFLAGFYYVEKRVNVF